MTKAGQTSTAEDMKRTASAVTLWPYSSLGTEFLALT